ncbi:MAG: chorismate mutase [Mycobacterium sp.]
MRFAVLAAGVIVGTTSVIAPPAGADPATPPNPLFQLVDTAAARLQTAEPVAATKWVKGDLIDDTKRVVEVLDSVDADGKNHGLDEAYVRRVFTDQINATEGIEYVRFSQWKLDPASAPAHAPDLSESRAAIDGFDQTMVAALAANQAVLHGPNCATTLNDARGAVIAARGLDPMYQQALSLATRLYCG